MMEQNIAVIVNPQIKKSKIEEILREHNAASFKRERPDLYFAIVPEQDADEFIQSLREHSSEVARAYRICRENPCYPGLRRALRIAQGLGIEE